VENNMVEALKLSEVEISRSLRKLKHLKMSWLGANSHKNHQQHKNLMSCWKLKW
jgi:DNA-binding transcriptional regulator GbsR (MarR family)